MRKWLVVWFIAWTALSCAQEKATVGDSVIGVAVWRRDMCRPAGARGFHFFDAFPALTRWANECRRSAAEPVQGCVFPDLPESQFLATDIIARISRPGSSESRRLAGGGTRPTLSQSRTVELTSGAAGNGCQLCLVS